MSPCRRLGRARGKADDRAGPGPAEGYGEDRGLAKEPAKGTEGGQSGQTTVLRAFATVPMAALVTYDPAPS